MSHAGGVRTWTDDQLFVAIANARSWRATARALGLKGTSAGVLRSIKRHAARLGIDTSHFTTGRSWSDHDLRRAIENARSWSDVPIALGLVDRPEARARVKGYALRAGIDFGHLQAPPLAAPPAVDDFGPELANLREAAESIAVAWFRLRGLPVAVPAGQQQYDLLVTFPTGVKRVQVKSGTRQPDHGSCIVGVGHRPYSLDKTAGHAPYDPDEIDYFFIVTGDGGLYFIPTEVVGGMTAISVGAYEKYRVGDASSLITAAA